MYYKQENMNTIMHLGGQKFPESWTPNQENNKYYMVVSLVYKLAASSLTWLLADYWIR
jgi:hypothetical protein